MNAKLAAALMPVVLLGASMAQADPRPSPEQPRIYMRFTVATGSDDLRGGGDNVTATVFFDGAAEQTYLLNQRGMRWADGSTHQTTVALPRNIRVSQLRAVTLSTSFRGGIDGDNWNMDGIRIEITGETRAAYGQVGSYGRKRFTADNGTLVIPLSPPRTQR